MCGRHESYLSTGRGLTLTQAVLESTVVAGLDWTLSYEFVSGSWQEEEEEGEDISGEVNRGPTPSASEASGTFREDVLTYVSTALVS